MYYSYLYTKSAYKLRKYLIENNYIKEIIDFGYKKVFKEASVYCCITIFSKIKKNTIIYNNIEIPIKNISKNDYFITVNNLSSNVTNKLLKDVCKISNGIATLRDNIYIHKNKINISTIHMGFCYCYKKTEICQTCAKLKNVC